MIAPKIIVAGLIAVSLLALVLMLSGCGGDCRGPFPSMLCGL